MADVIIGIAVNEYQDKEGFPSLSYAKEDIASLCYKFEKEYGYKKILVEHNARESQVMDALYRAEEMMGSGGRLIFAFAGHGFTTKNNHHYLICAEAKAHALQEDMTAAPYGVMGVDEVTKRILQMDGIEQTMLFIDACKLPIKQDGQKRGALQASFAGEQALDDVVKRMVVSVKPRRANQPHNLLIFNTCSDGQAAIEKHSLGRGVGTLAFEQTLDAYRQKHGNIAIDEEFKRDYTNISRQMNEAQIPVVKGVLPWRILDMKQPQPVDDSDSKQQEVISKLKDNLDNQIDEAANIFTDINSSEREKTSALKVLKEGAISGNTRAMTLLARANIFGEGCPKNYSDAVHWARKAAESNNPKALVMLGIMYESGVGVVKDNVEAASYYRKAVDMYEPDGIVRLGLMYESGEGVEQNEEEALSLYRTGVRLEQSESMVELARMYKEGKGVEKDESVAFSWYKKAAELNNADGMVETGKMYDSGNGTHENKKLAFHWFHKAADMGNSEGMYQLAVFYAEGDVVDKDEAEAVRWTRKAIDAGHVKAMMMLATCYDYGIGVEKNAAEATRWKQRAKDAGYVDILSYFKAPSVEVENNEIEPTSIFIDIVKLYGAGIIDLIKFVLYFSLVTYLLGVIYRWLIA